MTVPHKPAKSVHKQEQQANRAIFENLLVRDETLYANTVTAILEYAAHIKDACNTLKPLGGSYWNDFQDQCRGGQPSVSKFIKIADNPAYKDPKLIKCLPKNIAALYELCDVQPKALLAMPSSVAKVPKTAFAAKPVINPGLSLNQAKTLAGKKPSPSHAKTPQQPAPKPPGSMPLDATEQHKETALPEFLDLSLPLTEINGDLNAEIKERLTVMLNQLASEFPVLGGYQWEVAGDRMPQPTAAPPKPYKVGMKVRHSKFGNGTVTTVDDADTIQVQFADSIRKLKTAFAGLGIVNT